MFAQIGLIQANCYIKLRVNKEKRIPNGSPAPDIRCCRIQNDH